MPSGDVQCISGESLTNLSMTTQQKIARRNKIIMAAVNLRTLDIDESRPFGDEQWKSPSPGSDRDMR